MNKNTIRGAVALGTAVLVAFPAAAPVHAVDLLPRPQLQPQFGRATWYGEEFQGLHTASGELFDRHQMTAAHRTFPLGSIVRVSNPATGRAILVRVNDRGPVPRFGLIDLSQEAAEQLGIRAQGHAQVRLDLLPGQAVVTKN